MGYFTEQPRGDVRLGAAGKIQSGQDAASLLQRQPELPVSAGHQTQEGLGPLFIDYLRYWPGFVCNPSA